MRYTQSEKMEIIRMVEESSLSVKQTLAEIGVSRSTFYEWYKRYQEHGYEGLRSHHKSPRQIWIRFLNGRSSGSWMWPENIPKNPLENSHAI